MWGLLLKVKVNLKLGLKKNKLFPTFTVPSNFINIFLKTECNWRIRQNSQQQNLIWSDKYFHAQHFNAYNESMMRQPRGRFSGSVELVTERRISETSHGRWKNSPWIQKKLLLFLDQWGVWRGRSKTLPLPLLRKCWSIAQVAVVNSRGELICFYTLFLFVSLLFTLSTPLVMQQTTHFHYNQLSFLPKCMRRTSKPLRPLFNMKLALAALSYMLVIQ